MLFIIIDLINFKNISSNRILISATIAFFNELLSIIFSGVIKKMTLHYLSDILKILFGYDDPLLNSPVCSLGGIVVYLVLDLLFLHYNFTK